MVNNLNFLVIKNNPVLYNILEKAIPKDELLVINTSNFPITLIFCQFLNINI